MIYNRKGESNMVTSLARQSIIIKSKNHTSIVLGNYECAYCLGLLSKQAGLLEDDSYTDMTQWFAAVMEQTKDFGTEDKNLAEVIRMMRLYEPLPEMDEQMKELYHMGYHETRMWQM
jgi:hypothetical protein